MIIVPHPSLSAGQKAVVAADYDMKDGQAYFQVRYAMLFYVLKRLGLLDDAKSKDPRTQHIVAQNAQELELAMTRVSDVSSYEQLSTVVVL